MYNILKKLGGLMLGVVVLGGPLLTSCSEKLDEGNLYTFTGETVADFLNNSPEQFSDFTYILKRADMEQLLSAYGTFTCFAPTNEAVEEYVEQLYNDTTNVEFEHNGMTKPGLEGLTDSLCKDIAEYHLTNTIVNTVDMGDGITIATVLGRDLTTSLDSATTNVSINNYSLIISKDNEVENGIVHVINHVLRRSNNKVSGEIENLGTYRLWTQALQLTGLSSMLDESTREDVGVKVEQNDDKAYSLPAEACKEGFTVFAETDATFAKYGITTIDQLIDYANRAYGNCNLSSEAGGWYDYMYDNNIKVSTGTDYENQWNALNMFLRYHILPYSVASTKLTYSYNEISSAKLYEYNRTLLPNTLMKVSYDLRSGKWLINKGVEYSTLTSNPGSTTVDSELQKESEEATGVGIDTKNSANPLNGWIHPLEDILVYNHAVPYVVLKERIRFDDTSLLDEMMTNGFRGSTKAELVTLVKKSGKSRVIFPTKYFRNLVTYNDNQTVFKYLVKDEGPYANFQGDEFMCEGTYDFAIKLPSVPLDGTYEIRMGYTAETARGMLQVYLGSSSDRTTMQACDIPLDMRHVPEKTGDISVTGWLPSGELDGGVATDQAMRNHGYMRGAYYYYVEGPNKGNISRAHHKNLRRILYRGQLNQGEHWLRFKTVLPEETKTQFHLDYIELVPSDVYNNSTYSEDIF